MKNKELYDLGKQLQEQGKMLCEMAGMEDDSSEESPEEDMSEDEEEPEDMGLGDKGKMKALIIAKLKKK